MGYRCRPQLRQESRTPPGRRESNHKPSAASSKTVAPSTLQRPQTPNAMTTSTPPTPGPKSGTDTHDTYPHLGRDRLSDNRPRGAPQVATLRSTTPKYAAQKSKAIDFRKHPYPPKELKQKPQLATK
ncbi:hypothetical protein TSMEX_000602 [Taenia solium]|eukprot:TsM_001118600 transcript=TsM_001118600 gene=TsM_001118600